MSVRSLAALSLIAALLVVALATAPVNAQETVGICDRTLEVQDVILVEIYGTPLRDECDAVTSAQLADIPGSLIVREYSSASIVPGDFEGLTMLTELRITDSPLLTDVPANAFSAFSSSSSLRQLHLDRNGIERVHEDAFDGLSDVTHIFLNHNTIASLDEGTFDGLSALEHLILKNNRLESLPEGLFDGLTNLINLPLGSNHIKVLEDGIFEDLGELTGLHLQYNRLSELGDDTFDGLDSLDEINLSYNMITSIHPDTFNGLDSLRQINLSSNMITSIHQDTFAGLTNLTKISLPGNHIESVPEGLFDGLVNLQQLHLHNNRITSLDVGTFDGLANVYYISLSGNDISSIHEETFDGLGNLEYLFLQSNSITTLPVGLFEDTTALYYLYLHLNSIATLEADIFNGLTSLNALALSRNRFSSLDPDLFSGLTGLSYLYLNHNEIASPDADLFDGLTALSELYLHENEIASPDEELFDGLTGLSYLDLSNNGMASPDENLFDGLTGLSTLNLSNNGMASPDGDLFDGLTGLSTLNLSNNGMASPDGDLFDGLTGLSTLNLSNNGMASPDGDLFDGLTGLSTLNLSNNGMASPDEDLFDGPTALATLNLSNNSMASLDVGLFDGLVDLTALDLSGNSITRLTAGVFDGLDDSLTSLYLRSNGLASLPAGTFDGLTGLTGLDLSCNALTALDLARFDPFASTLTFLEISGNRFTTPPTETALRAKLPNARYLYTGTNTLCGPPDDTAITGVSISPGSTPDGDPLGTALAMVDHDVSKTTVTLTARDPNTEIVPYPANSNPLYDDDRGMPGWQVRLPTYRNVFQWQVRSKNGTIGAVNSLIVFRSHPASSEARLRSLELSNISLEPTFDGRTYTYSAATVRSETIVTATPLDPDATTVIKLNGRVDADGNVDLEMGSNNVITVEVTAEDGTTTEIYTVTVTRTPLEVTLPAPRLPAEDDPRAIWLAKLTVASLDFGELGYDGAQCGRGGLTDTAFTYLGDNTPISQRQSYTKVGTLYTFDKVYYGGGKFQLSLDKKFQQDSAENIVVVVDRAGLQFSDASYSSSSHTYSWTVPDPSWSVGAEVPVKILVLKDADGPDGLAATTFLSPHTGPSGHKYETRDLTLTWSAPTSGGAVTGYRVEYQPDPAFQWKTLVGSQSDTIYMQSGKLRDEVDYYRVAALRSGGTASYSDVVRVQVPPDSPKVPQQVGYVEAGPAACSGLKVAWNRAKTPIGKSGDGVGSGVRARGYQVQYAPDDGGYPTYRVEGEDWSTVTLPRWLDGLLWQPWSGSIEEIEFRERMKRSPDVKTVITGLAPDTKYRVRVRGCNDASCGEWTIPALAKAGMAVANAVDAVEAEPLTASFASAPEAHDGESGFQVQIAFSEDVEITPEDMRDHALLVSGGTVTGAAGVDGRKDLWQLTVEPSGTGPVSILAPQDRACTETGALCTSDGRSLTVSLALQVSGPPAQQANSPATGAPSIIGTAQVGETLTADTAGMGDADGLANATYSYQWIRNEGSTDTDIENATDSSYTLAAEDEGQTIRVKVFFTDDADNEETLTSAATEAVGPPSTLKATEAEPLTASFALAPEAHDGENGFKLRIAFSDAVEITPEDMRDHALLVSGGTVTDAARVKGRSDLWELTVEPDGTGPVSILAPLGRACTDQGALCTADGRSLTAGPALVVPGPPAESPPGVPDQPEGTAVFIGGVDLEWNDVPGADSYEVQQSRGGQWTGLPADGVEVAFYGAGAIISGLDPEASLWFRVRAANGHGVSDWSEMLYMNTTSQFKAGRKARPDNAPASGAPVVHGTAQAGESLWADATGIEDGNGLDRVQFRYQWVSGDGNADTDIAGATDSGYTLVAADVGRTIKVKVAFTDRGGYSETRTSVATGAVAVEAAPQPDSPATGQPAITGTAQVGETLTADTSGIADADGMVNAAFAYQWLSDDAEIGGATGSTYTLVAGDEGRTIKVRVIVTDDLGNETTLTSAATEAVAAAPPTDSPATGEPTIIGTAQVGQTLIVNITGIADADGLTTSTSTYSYQWLSDDAEIGGATGSTYTLVAGDEGRTIKVRVIVTDDLGNETTLTSAATEAVAAAPPTDSPATGEPTISGTAQVGQTLIVNITGIADADGLTTSTYSYQWLSDDAEIGGATGSTYTLVAADEGRTIKVRVIVTDDLGNETTLTSAATEAVAAAPPTDSPATGEPTISGTAQVGQTLSVNITGIADADGLTTSTYSYQWLSDDAEIGGATGSTYTLVAADEGRTIKVRVIVTDDLGNETTLTSAATEAVAAAPPTDSPATGEPTISGTAQVGQTLTVNITGIADADGLTTSTYSYQWIANDGGTDADISGATDDAYTLVAGDAGKTIQVRVSFTDDAENEETLTSEATGEVASGGPTEPPGPPLKLKGTANADGTVTLRWEAPDDDTVTGYQILRKRISRGEQTLLVHVNDTGSTATEYTDSDVTPDVLHAYRVKAINAAGLSKRSNVVKVTPVEPEQPSGNSAATGRPSIGGTPQVGEVLTADTSGIGDDDGLTNVSYSYQWVVTDGGAYIDISGATGATYTLVAADRGLYIQVRVSFTDDAKNGETLTSALTEVVAAAP